MSDDEQVIGSSGNVFADLGLPDADEKKDKVRLAMAINDELAAMHPQDVAQLGFTYGEIVALRHLKLSQLSIERLNELWSALVDWNFGEE